jgi:hypothetical protein
MTISSRCSPASVTDEDAADCGVLMLFDEHAEDLKAAIRLCRANQCRR